MISDSIFTLVLSAFFIVSLSIVLVATPPYPDDALTEIDTNPNCFVTVGPNPVKTEGVLESCNIEVGQ